MNTTAMFSPHENLSPDPALPGNPQTLGSCKPVSKEEILGTIYEAIDEVNGQFSLDVRLDEATALIGDASGFDSLGFVNFIASLEQKCEQRFNLQLCLTGSRPGDPAAHLDSVSALAAHILHEYNSRNAS